MIERERRDNYAYSKEDKMRDKPDTDFFIKEKDCSHEYQMTIYNMNMFECFKCSHEIYVDDPDISPSDYQ